MKKLSKGNVVTYFYRRKIFEATEYGDKNRVLSLLKKGVNINVKDSDGNSLLYSATYWRYDIDLVKLLLERGIDVNSQNKLGNTVLHTLLSSESMLHKLSLAVMESIYNRINKQNSNFSSKYSEIDFFRLLLDSGANPNIQNNEGSTILHEACRGGDMDLIELLVNYGADVNIKDNKGNTPIAISCMKNDTKAVKIMIRKNTGYPSKVLENNGVIYKNINNGTLLDIAKANKNKEMQEVINNKNKEAIVELLQVKFAKSKGIELNYKY